MSNTAPVIISSKAKKKISIPLSWSITRLLFFSGILSAVFLSCSKDQGSNPEEHPITDTPFIELSSVSPTTIHQYDSLIFEVKYTDGNGDLGDYDADTLSLWITDNRFPLTEKFHIPPLAPQGSAIIISGTLSVTLDHIILKDASSTSETATFTVKLKDRAGNWSNEVTSGEIVVLP